MLTSKSVVDRLISLNELEMELSAFEREHSRIIYSYIHIFQKKKGHCKKRQEVSGK